MDTTTSEHDVWMAKIMNAVRSLRAENGRHLEKSNEHPQRPKESSPNQGRG
jgi:hypothetical protein